MIRLLHHWTTLSAERAPESIAVVMEGQAIAYGELERRSNRLARGLKDAGCERGDRVCLLSPKSLDAIVALLAIIKADCTFVPLDPQCPAARHRKIIESCASRCLLAGGNAAALLDEILAAGAFAFPLSVGGLGDARIDGPRCRAAFSSSDFSTYSAAPLDCRNESS